VSYEIQLSQNLALYKAHFAPNDYRILFTGSDYSGTGKTDIFLLDFDSNHPEKQTVNLTVSFSVGDGVTAATWASKEKVFTLCSETLDTEATAFCWLNPQTGEISFIESIKPNFDGMRLYGGYWLSPSDDKLAAILFPENALGGDALPELRLFDWNGRSNIVLSQSLGFSYVDFSPSGKYIAYVSMDKAQLVIFNISTNIGMPITTMPDISAFSWLGWVR
jgi:WD40 repeat protein